jgi:hypothetical protein
VVVRILSDCNGKIVPAYCFVPLQDKDFSCSLHGFCFILGSAPARSPRFFYSSSWVPKAASPLSLVGLARSATCTVPLPGEI